MQSKNKNVYVCIFSEFTHILKNLQYLKSTMGHQARQAGRLVRWPRPVGGRRGKHNQPNSSLTHCNTVTKPSGELTRSAKNQWSWAYWSRDIIPALER